jgi:poly(3-hydroxybutyrate) depolymerase
MVKKNGRLLWAVLAACGLAGCGHDSQTARVAVNTQRGALAVDPPLRVASLTASAFAAQLNASATGEQLVQLAGTPACGVDFYYLNYWTVDPAGSPTEVSGALMVPTGSTPQCSGPRPIVLYAHGTAESSQYNIADITDPSNSAYGEAAMIAAVFAAQGYIVVAPNYEGYDISTLGYHPYLDATVNADDMEDALAAARAALPHTFTPHTTDDGQLFITGYSEGGYVAMATVKAMQAAGQTVTASAPSSGPYAIEALGDLIFTGQVDIGSTVFAPLITTSYQHAYDNVYSQPSDVYSSTYAGDIATLLPSPIPLTTLFSTGKLPEAALFDSTTPISSTGVAQIDAAADALLAEPASPPYSPSEAALFDAGFGTPYLINNTYRVQYVDDAIENPDEAAMTVIHGGTLDPSDIALATAPTIGLREDFKLNDMRNGGWAPEEPMLMCGADQDPTVFFEVDTGTMAAEWSAQVQAGLVSVLDLDATPSGPYAPLQQGFQSTYAALVSAEGASTAIQSFHGTEAPFCMVAARDFFAQVP